MSRIFEIKMNKGQNLQQYVSEDVLFHIVRKNVYEKPFDERIDFSIKDLQTGKRSFPDYNLSLKEWKILNRAFNVTSAMPFLIESSSDSLVDNTYGFAVDEEASDASSSKLYFSINGEKYAINKDKDNLLFRKDNEEYLEVTESNKDGIFEVKETESSLGIFYVESIFLDDSLSGFISDAINYKSSFVVQNRKHVWNINPIDEQKRVFSLIQKDRIFTLGFEV
jgi:hypothetical protein